MSTIFDKTVSLLGAALDLRSTRHRLLSSNLANVETPGYKAVDIRFEDEMKKRAGNGSPAYLERTSPLHLVSSKGPHGQPGAVDAATEVVSYDNNSVGLDTEMVKLSENSLMYTVASRLIREKFGLLMTAIKEGGR